MVPPPMSTAEKSPLLSHAEFRQLQWVLGCLLVMISAGTVLFLDVEAWGLLAAIIAGSALVLVRADLPARIPSWCHRLAFPVIMGLFCWDLWWEAGLLPAMVRLCLWLLFYRAVCHRSRREDLQLVLLGLFLIVVAGVLTVHVAFALLLILFTFCALALLLVVTTGDSLAAAGRADDSWHRNYSLRRILSRVRHTLDWRHAGAAVLIFSLMVGASAMIFVSIPRFHMENALLLERLFPRKSSTGFSESLRFGEVTRIAQDTTLSFTVDVPTGSAMPSTPYFRMMVLDECLPEGGGFQVSPGLRREAFGAERSSAAIEGIPRLGPDSVDWTIYFEPSVSRNLPLPGAYTRVRLRDFQPLRNAPSLRLIQLREEPMAMFPYRVEGALDESHLSDPGFASRWRQFGAERRARSPRRFMLDLPTDDASRRLLSEQLVRASLPTEDSAAFSAAASRWLASTHRYSLSNTLPPGAGDPVLRWLASSQPGHCEFFASSFVLLARASGFPARVVVGFRGGVWNTFSNSLSIRNSDAHAWCEIWDGNSGWQRVDPTPGAAAQASITDASSPVAGVRADSGWSARFDGLRVLWYRRIVNFDHQTQAEALTKTKGFLREALSLTKIWLTSLKERVAAFFSQHGRFAGASVVLGTAFLALLISWLVLSWRRRWRWRWNLRKANRGTDSAAADPVRREAGLWLRRYPALPADHSLREQLQRLRYGPVSSWSRPEEVFAAARRYAAV